MKNVILPTILNLHLLNKKASAICVKVILSKRTDDSENVVSYRLQVYHEQTQPVVEFYRKKGYLTLIDGTLSKEEVYTHIEQAISKTVCPAS